jgi:hypothetical protein
VARKTAEQINQENLEIAQRVLATSTKRADNLEAEAKAARSKANLAARRVQAARLLLEEPATEDDADAETGGETDPAL